MKHHPKLTIAVASLMCASSLSANWQECIQLPYGYNAPYLEENCSSRFFAEVDYLLFYANQEGLSYSTLANTDVIINPSLSTPTSPTTMETRDQFFENKWDSGVRGSLGFKPCTQSWDILASYTYFGTNVKGGTTSGMFVQTNINVANSFLGEGVSILNSFLPNLIGSPASTGIGIVPVSSNNTSTWRLYFNQFDLNFGREFYVACDARLRPFFGLRGLWTHQRLHEISLFEFTRIATPVDINLDFIGKNKFNAVGATVGFDSTYEIGKGLELFGNLSGSLLWGRFTVNQTFSNVLSTSSETLTLANETATHSHQASSLNVDIVLGIRYNTWLNCGRNLLTFKFGWEQHLYTNMNQFQNFIMNDAVGLDALGLPVGTTRSTNFTLDKNVQRGSLYLAGFVFGLAYIY